MRSSPEVIKRWSNEAQEAVNSDSQMPQYHGLGLLYSMRKSDKLAVNKMVQKYSKRGFRSAHAQLFLVNFCFRFPHNFRGSDFFLGSRSVLLHVSSKKKDLGKLYSWNRFVIFFAIILLFPDLCYIWTLSLFAQIMIVVQLWKKNTVGRE